MSSFDEDRYKSITGTDLYIAKLFFTPEELETMHKYIVIKESKIHGLGTFARTFIPAGTTIGWYRGFEWSGVGDDSFVYCFDHGGLGHFEMVVVGPLRFANHSADYTNISGEEKMEWWETDPYVDNGKLYYKEVPFRSVEFTTLDDVAEGEELLSDYGDDFQEWLDNGQPD